MATNPTKLNLKVNQNNVTIFTYNPGMISQIGRTDPKPKKFTPNQTWSTPKRQFKDTFNGQPWTNPCRDGQGSKPANSAEKPQKNQNSEFIYAENYHFKTQTQRIKEKKDCSKDRMKGKKVQNSVQLKTGGFGLAVQNQTQNDVSVSSSGHSNKSPRHPKCTS
jgi:hypothetical protein